MRITLGSRRAATETNVPDYNELLAKAICPACGLRKVLRFRFRVASSSAGTSGGRFTGNEYQIGDKLRWWPVSDKHFLEWLEPATERTGPSAASELCAGACPACEASLTAVVEFQNLRVTGIRGIAEGTLPAAEITLD
jgi:hypothetical protein